MRTDADAWILQSNLDDAERKVRSLQKENAELKVRLEALELELEASESERELLQQMAALGGS